MGVESRIVVGWVVVEPGVVVPGIVEPGVVVVGWVVGKVILPSTYPKSPLDPNNWVILVVHDIKLSPLNFCSSERIVKEGTDDIVYKSTVVQVYELLFYPLAECSIWLKVCDTGAHNLL